MSLSFHILAHGYTFRTPVILSIGNSDFGFVSYFVFRASNFLYFLPGSVEIILVYRQRRSVYQRKNAHEGYPNEAFLSRIKDFNKLA